MSTRAMTAPYSLAVAALVALLLVVAASPSSATDTEPGSPVTPPSGEAAAYVSWPIHIDCEAGTSLVTFTDKARKKRTRISAIVVKLNGGKEDIVRADGAREVRRAVRRGMVVPSVVTGRWNGKPARFKVLVRKKNGTKLFSEQYYVPCVDGPSRSAATY